MQATSLCHFDKRMSLWCGYFGSNFDFSCLSPEENAFWIRVIRLMPGI
jgi:hypothetical protein